MTSATDGRTETYPAAVDAGRRFRSRGLFGKYALAIASLVIVLLAVNGTVEAWIIYRTAMTNVTNAQRQLVEMAARRTESFLVEVERQVSWVTRASAISMQDHRTDYQLLISRVPAVISVTFVDADKRAKLKVARVGVTSDTNDDLSRDPAVLGALDDGTWLGATTTGERSELLIAMSHAGADAGVTIVHLDLSELSTLVTELPLLGDNNLYVLDAKSTIVAASKGAPDPVGTNLGARPALAALLADVQKSMKRIVGVRGDAAVLSAAPIRRPSWTAVVEEPSRIAFGSLSDFFLRFAWLMALGLVLALAAGLLLARRMILPIRALHAGAARLAANDFDHRIAVDTGDELEELAGQFNRMSADLAGSYRRLEVKVEERTRELAQSVNDMKALEEIGRALSASLDLSAVVGTIVSRAIPLAQADAGAVFLRAAGSNIFNLRNAEGFEPKFRTAASTIGHELSALLAAVAGTGRILDVPHIAEEKRFPIRDETLEAGLQAALVVGLEASGGIPDVLVLYRKVAGALAASTLDVMATFAHQSVLAIHNARLFQELVAKGRQLEVASAHRTQFFANMSHELRTPLNAVLGYSELLRDGLYGDMPQKATDVLDRIQVNGKHLLGLINDVLDLTKMEAGALTLSFDNYAMKALVESVVASTEALARTKGLGLSAEVPDGLPIGCGDERRLTQILFNLVGNALKFTDVGEIRIVVALVGGSFQVSVHDTGPGISSEQQKRIFDEFQQVNDASTLKKGGSGLGLSISQRLAGLHDGRIEVRSAPGEGSTFTLIIPVRIGEQSRVA